MTRRHFGLGLVTAGLLCAAAGVLWHITRSLTFDAVEQALHHTPVASLYAAALATAVSFVGLAYFDRFATRLIAPAAFASPYAWYVGAVSHAVSNTLGFPVITGSALRYRLYRQSGMGAAEIASVITLVGLCVALDSVTVLLTAFIIAPATSFYGRATCFAGMITLLAGLGQIPRIGGFLRRHGLSLPAMTRTTLLLPFFVGIMEGGAVICAFYTLLPEDIRPGFAVLASIVVGAMMVGVLSHSPGGIGVFEAAILATFPGGHHADVLAALLLFRLIYNIFPFLLAVLLLTAQQGHLAGRSSVRRRV